MARLLAPRVLQVLIGLVVLAPAPWAAPSLPVVDLAQASIVLKDLVLATLA
ncbi:MAG TPA: hypothetical protein VKB41_01535 [Steroidobacteraceae bacterium]|jgi:hypothetical protein|nr:hypothetical protein [Steroidobacteraceae bacterium]